MKGTETILLCPTTEARQPKGDKARSGDWVAAGGKENGRTDLLPIAVAGETMSGNYGV